MKIRLMAAAASAAAVLGATALVAPPVSAGGTGSANVLSVQKLVLGETDTPDFDFTVDCQSPPLPQATPAAEVGPFTLADGESFDTNDTEMDTNFANGVPCVIVETANGTPPGDAWVVVTTSEGEVIEAQEDDVPLGADFAWFFTTLIDESIDYNVLVVNDYSTGGTADELCAVIVEQVGALSTIADSIDDIESLTPEQITDLWEVSLGLFTAGAAVAPPEIKEAWDHVTVAYVQVGAILSSVGFDVDALSADQLAAIDSILTSIEGDSEAIVAFLGANCIPDPPSTTTTAATAAVAATPQYTG